MAQLASPLIRIVSLTITEGGYFIDPASGVFDPAHPAIVEDARDPAAPKTVFGLILAGLAERRAKGIPPFTIMSCDIFLETGRSPRLPFPVWRAFPIQALRTGSMPMSPFRTAW